MICPIASPVFIIAGPYVRSSSYAVLIASPKAMTQHNSQTMEWTIKEAIKLSRVMMRILSFIE